jgi:hypothetical protein
MLGVDKSDQMRAAGGAFAAKAHYQKWYKRAYFAILDMITLNALIVWNLLAQTPTRKIGQRTVLKIHDFLWYISQSMLNFKDTASVTTRESDITLDGHSPMACTDYNARCAVCRLDWNMERLAAAKAGGNKGTSTRSLKQSKREIASKLVVCTKCRIAAHPTVPPKARRIHALEEIQGLTCYQIAHTASGYQIWKRCLDNTGRAYNPQMKHPICNHLREQHGLDPTSARKQKQNNASVLDSSSSDSEDDD